MISLVRTLGVPCMMVAFVVAAGCDRKPAADTTAIPAAQDRADQHEHAAEARPTVGPHRGHLIEFGVGEYYAEWVHDESTGTLVIYLLDKEATSAVSIPDPEIVLNLDVDGSAKRVALAADPQGGDPQGEASRFSVVDASVIEALKDPTTTGKIGITIHGKLYSGTLEHDPREEHET